MKAILGDGERVRERERDERSEGVESECEVSVKASLGGIVIGKIVSQGCRRFFSLMGNRPGEGGVGGGEECGGEEIK